jgi:nickel transport system permease protein
MKKYIFKRILLTIPMLLAVSFIAFVLMSFMPSDPAEVALRVNEVIPTEEAVLVMRQELGLDKPFLVRYVNWLVDCLRLDLGSSYINRNRTVVGELARCLPHTLKLASLSLVLLLCISIPIGILSAVYKNSLLDKVVRMIVFIGTAMPNYWLALILIYFFGVYLKWFPTHGASTFNHYILPAFTLSMGYISTYVRLIRGSVLENMNENYVFYGRVRGFSEKRILWKHILKNSLHSCMTALGMSVVQLIAGTVVIENIFSIPGIGRLCISAIFNRDYPVIQAYILLMGVLFVGFNLIVDILQCIMDPRLKQGVVK